MNRFHTKPPRMQRGDCGLLLLVVALFWFPLLRLIVAMLVLVVLGMIFPEFLFGLIGVVAVVVIVAIIAAACRPPLP